MKILVIGAGYVGLVSAVCFASFGHKVYCVDSNKDLISKLNRGQIDIYEPSLDELLLQAKAKNNIVFCNTDDDIIASFAPEVVIIAVGTPSLPNGIADLSFVVEAARAAIKLKPQALVIKSTVPIATAAKLRATLNIDKEISIISNPEFLREGFAVADFMNPSRIVIGHDSENGKKIGLELYKVFEEKGIPINFVDNSTAELAKYAANSFLALKVTFINEICDLALKIGADIKAVSHILGQDPRIGSLWLNPGPGYGGACFPKDTKALWHSAKQYDLDLRLIDAVIKSNEERKEKLTYRIIDATGANKKIAILGVTFKAGTDDVRESAAISITEKLLKAQYEIRVYDPKGMDNFTKIFANQVEYAKDSYSCVENIENIVILTEWPEFQKLDFQKLYISGVRQIFDFRNIFHKEKVEGANIIYRSLNHV